MSVLRKAYKDKLIELKNYHLGISVESDQELHVVANSIALALKNLDGEGKVLCKIDGIHEVQEMMDGDMEE